MSSYAKLSLVKGDGVWLGVEPGKNNLIPFTKERVNMESDKMLKIMGFGTLVIIILAGLLFLFKT